MSKKKYFTVEEANALIPKLMEHMPRLQDYFDRLHNGFPDVKLAWKKSKVNGGSVQGADYLGIALRANYITRELEELGCVIKGVENGLLDFLALRDGKEVYLCWKFPETEIKYWHDLDTGFGGRQPI